MPSTPSSSDFRVPVVLVPLGVAGPVPDLSSGFNKDDINPSVLTATQAYSSCFDTVGRLH